MCSIYKIFIHVCIFTGHMKYIYVCVCVCVCFIVIVAEKTCLLINVFFKFHDKNIFITLIFNDIHVVSSCPFREI